MLRYLFLRLRPLLSDAGALHYFRPDPATVISDVAPLEAEMRGACTLTQWIVNWLESISYQEARKDGRICAPSYSL